MLYLEPPFHIIDGISIFRDHEDILQYYFMPLNPHLTVKKDETTGEEIPQIQLIKYRGEAGSGGFLNFDVNLGISEDKLSEIRASVRALENLDDEPRLAPVPLLDGFVKLMMLGKQTNPEASDDAAVEAVTDSNKPQFVINMQHYAKPALYGDNQASFSVELDDAGVVVVEESIQGNMAPIGVVYGLDYMALRNGYKVKLSVNWDRVQKHLDESFNIETPVFSTSISTVVDELIENRTIDMQVDKLFVSDDSTAAMEARMDQAINQIKEMITDNFFEPSLDPIPTGEGGDDKVDDAARIGAMLFSGGASELKGSFSYKKTDITRIDKKKLDVSFSERTAVVKSIYPQGHLEGLFSVLRDGTDLSRFIIPVELDHPWFQKRTVNVIARTDFETDNVESLNVKLDYGGVQKNVVLDKSKTNEKIEWLSKIEDGEMLKDVSISYDVHFKDSDSMERPIKLSSTPETIKIENFEVRPNELYGNLPVAIMALDFPWETYSHIEVITKYEDLDNGINIDESFLLDSKKTEAIWNLFTLDPKKTTFSYKLIYRAVDHRDLEMPWAETDNEKITIRDPFPNKRKISFVPAVNWTEVKNIFVDVTYEDEENSIREQQAVSFNESDNNPKEIVLQEFKNPEQRIIQYKVTLLFTDGRILEVPTCQTLTDRVFITPQMRGHKIITIDPGGIAFKAKKIKEAKLTVKYEDIEAGLSFNDSFSFATAKDRIRYFEYDFMDAEQAELQYQLTLHHTNGMNKSTDWIKSNEDELTLSIN